MSVREADRAAVIRDVVKKRVGRREAAERLGMGVRQIKRLARRYRERGAAGLVSGHRGKPPNNAIDAGVRREVVDLVRKRYRDFGPTFAHEKLVEEHGHRLSVETLRQWMIADGLWRAMRVHQSRQRRECLGDLVQIDGSPHAWFEDRGPACVLIVYVDDATTRLLATGFFARETTEAYMQTTRGHLAAHGRPVAYYSGRHSVFRANKTLQDRLVKEIRLREISDMAAGNAYLPEFMADFNRRFAPALRNPEDAHRAVLRDAPELDLIFCEHHRRKLMKNLTIRFECHEYQVTGRGRGYRLRGAEVTACEVFDGSATVLREGRELPVRLLAKGEEPIPVEDGKNARGRVDAAKAEQRALPAYKPPPDHPWRRPFKPAAASAAAGDEAANAGGRAVDLWTSPAVRRAPFGACGQPVDNALGRVAVDQALRRALPTGCPHSRASRPQPHSSAISFSSRKREWTEPQKGHFCFALAHPENCPTTCEPGEVVGFQRYMSLKRSLDDHSEDDRDATDRTAPHGWSSLEGNAEVDFIAEGRDAAYGFVRAWPNHFRTTLAFLLSTLALSLEFRGRDLVNSACSLASGAATRSLTYSEPLSARKPRMANGNRSSRPSRAGTKKRSEIADVLELRDLVDNVDQVDALVAVEVALVDGVHAHEAGPAAGARWPPLADGHPSRPGPVQHGALARVGRGLAQVVEVADGDARQTREATVAVHLELATHHLARGRPGHLAERRVHLRQRANVGHRVAAFEGPPRRAAAPVHDLARLHELSHQACQLRPRQSRGLAQEALHQTPVGLAEARVIEPLPHPRHEGVGLVARNGVKSTGSLPSRNARTCSGVRSLSTCRLKIISNDPKPTATGSLLVGIKPFLQAHSLLDKAV